jgi:uncharacterized membrane protein YfcA
MAVDNGSISTALITLIVIILGVFVADPALVGTILPPDLAKYSAVILAVLVAIYNYLYPRVQTSEPPEPPEKPGTGV